MHRFSPCRLWSREPPPCCRTCSQTPITTSAWWPCTATARVRLSAMLGRHVRTPKRSLAAHLFRRFRCFRTPVDTLWCLRCPLLSRGIPSATERTEEPSGVRPHHQLVDCQLGTRQRPCHAIPHHLRSHHWRPHRGIRKRAETSIFGKTN